MDTPEPSRLGRRALPLIGGSLVVVVVASLIYLHPTPPSLPKAPVAPPSPSRSTVPEGYSARYDFITATTGWVLLLAQSPSARFYVYRTTDGAKHWNMQLSADANFDFGEIKFFDSKRGVIWIGSPVLLYRTTDAGTHWNAVRLPPYQVNLITFSDPSHGWLLASERDRGLLRHFLATTDGGSTWTELAWPEGAAWANDRGAGHLQFRRPGEGWLAAAGVSAPTLYSTVDGGASWEPHVLPRTSAPYLAFESFVRLLPGIGVIAYVDYSGPAGAINSVAYSSIDGGGTWRSLTPPPDIPVWNVAFQDSSHWWATYSPTRALWKSSDAGESWKSVPQQSDVFEVQIIDAKHAWAQLGQAGLAMTSDGGLHWTQVDAPRPS